jgi:hypothetical protein
MRQALAAIGVLLLLGYAPTAALDVEILQSIGGLPPHIVGTFEEPLNFQQGPDGTYYVFDRRGHTVHTVDRARTTSRKAVEIGQEPGRILQPTAFDLGADGSFVVADVARNRQRVQRFAAGGQRLSGFDLPGQPAALIVHGAIMLNGVGSIQHSANALLISHPESGALFTEYTFLGYSTRSLGRLRDTGFEADRQLHIAMNAGLPLVDPTGGYYYVFVTGRPMFRKYDADGTLLFERHIEGRELDPFVDAQPTAWPTRRVQDREVPLVNPAIRTAAVDGQGRLWVSLAVPFTYVYDATGDKVRTLQLRAAGVISPTSLFFTPAGRLLVTPGCYEFDPGAR